MRSNLKDLCSGGIYARQQSFYCDGCRVLRSASLGTFSLFISHGNFFFETMSLCTFSSKVWMVCSSHVIKEQNRRRFTLAWLLKPIKSMTCGRSLGPGDRLLVSTAADFLHRCVFDLCSGCVLSVSVRSAHV